jgi:hypothetical protein
MAVERSRGSEGMTRPVLCGIGSKNDAVLRWGLEHEL